MTLMPSCLTLLHLNLPRLTAPPDAGARPSLSLTGAGCSGARGRRTLKEQDPVAIQDAIRIYGPMTAGAPILAAQVLAHVTHSLDHLFGMCEGDFPAAGVRSLYDGHQRDGLRLRACPTRAAGA
ncbi:hypothetical protein GCM10008019_25250 [Deinococcus soli (ex Cha et al. 2016)]|nr:hypothetical protein GCM10008019_25250 [Deinococcus soli (ex Cha et al. 2016)]